MSASHTTSRGWILAGAAVVLVLEFSLGSQHPVTVFGLITLVSTVVFDAFARCHTHHLLLSIAPSLAIAACAKLFGLDQWLAALLPALIQATLACLVARTLLPGKVPAIRRIAAALHDEGSPMQPDVESYTRRITWIWVATFILLALLNAVAVFRPWQSTLAPAAWSLVDLTVIAAVIVLEFLYRRQRYAEYTMDNFAEFWQRLRQLDPRSILLS